MAGMGDHRLFSGVFEALNQKRMEEAVQLWKEANASKGRCSDDYCLFTETPTSLTCARCLEGRLWYLSLSKVEENYMEMAKKLDDWIETLTAEAT